MDSLKMQEDKKSQSNNNFAEMTSLKMQENKKSQSNHNNFIKDARKEKRVSQIIKISKRKDD